MEIRKFIFSIVTKFDARGFKEADKAADAAGKTAARTAKYWSVLAAEQMKAARAAEQAAKSQTAAAAEAEKAAVKVSAATKRISGDGGGRGLADASRALGEFRDRFAGLGSLASTAAIGLGAFLTAAVAVGTGVITTGASFESLRTQLTTLTGSTARGEAAFSEIKAFAKATPFEVDQVTRAFIALKTRGVLPTTDTLTALGDLSSSFGGDLEQIVNAISGAARGETDPLERFVSSVKVSNGKITLGFRDQKVVIDQNVESITKAVAEFGRLEGVQGAMAAQSKTTNGVISNLKDAFSQFLDEVAQLGVLDEFKALLSDLINFGGPGSGLAGIIADFLVTGLKALREILAGITEEDIRSFLQGAVNTAKELVDIAHTLTEALRFVIEVSGGTSDAFMNMTLVAYALVAALGGPAGLVLAAGAVGLALGNVSANLLSNATAAEVARAQIEMYSKSIAEIETRLNAIDARFAAHQTDLEEDRKKREAQAKAKVQRTVGGLGGGLAQAEVDDAAFRAQQIIAGSATEAEQGKSALLTAEGRKVFEAVGEAQKRQVDRAAKAARTEAQKRGASSQEVAAAEQSARVAASAAAQANRQKAFEAATTSFGATGSVSKATRAAENIIEAGEKKAAGQGAAGKKGDVFFDFEKEASAAAKSQGEKFAGEELQRLREEGIAFDEALALSKEAGQKREKELKQKFLDAGKVFDASANNILDILGLKGPGSILEGRPPPQNLMIAPVINFTMFGEFHQNIASVDGAAALAEITGTAGQAAVEAGAEDAKAKFMAFFDAAMDLRIGQLMKADAGGKLPQGPEG